MNSSTQSTEEKLKPGTVVLQYVNDGNSLLGIVVSEPPPDSVVLELCPPGDQVERYCLLVLLWRKPSFSPPFDVYARARSVFPSYVWAESRTASVADFTDEIALYERHDGDQSAGMVPGASLRRQWFSFSQEQLLALALWDLANVYGTERGITEGTLPRRTKRLCVNSLVPVEKILTEFRRSLP